MPEDLTDKQRMQMVWQHHLHTLYSATKIMLNIGTDHCGSGQLMSMINFDNSVQVRAMGALLAILQQEMILDNAPDGDDDGSLTPLQIGEISQRSMYSVNRAYYSNQELVVPNIHKQSNLWQDGGWCQRLLRASSFLFSTAQGWILDTGCYDIRRPTDIPDRKASELDGDWKFERRVHHLRNFLETIHLFAIVYSITASYRSQASTADPLISSFSADLFCSFSVFGIMNKV